jgi:nucleotide-binding universal stress UspA family protein
VDQVLFAADGSPHARRALECLVSLPWITRATVHVLSVDDGHVDVEQAAGEAEEHLADAGVGSRRIIRPGKPARVILEECDDKNPDLVVMGARGITGFKRLMIGSSTAAVAGGTDHSLLVAHARSDEGSGGRQIS